MATSRALFRLLRPGFSVESRRAQHALESAERAIPPPLAGLARTQLRNVSKGASGARDGDGAAVRARVAQWARHARCLPRQLLVEAARAVAALWLVVEGGVRARGAGKAGRAGTGAPGEADGAQRRHLG